METGDNIDVAVPGEREAMGSAEAAIPDGCLTVGANGPDGIVGVERRCGDEEDALPR